MKVYTVTPNPALDLSGCVDRLVPNEKNYVQTERRDPGGNGINASRIIRRLGVPTLALGFLGGPVGEEVRGLLEREGVESRFTRIASNTRTNVTVTEMSAHEQTRLTFHGPRVSRTEERALLAAISRLRAPGILVLGGSLPQGCSPDLHLKMARAGARRGLGVVIDVPARFIDEATRGFRPLMMKPNQTELEEWAGKKLRSDAALKKAALELARQVDLVVVSLAARGAILAYGASAWFAPAPRVRARGTVGAGDSMVGAICAELCRRGVTESRSLARKAAGPGTEMPPVLREALRWGLAAGAATAEVTGTELARPAEIRRLAKRIRLA